MNLLTTTEAAARLGISSSAVRKRVEKLRREGVWLGPNKGGRQLIDESNLYILKKDRRRRQ